MLSQVPVEGGFAEGHIVQIATRSKVRTETRLRKVERLPGVRDFLHRGLLPRRGEDLSKHGERVSVTRTP